MTSYIIRRLGIGVFTLLLITFLDLRLAAQHARLAVHQPTMAQDESRAR